MISINDISVPFVPIGGANTLNKTANNKIQTSDTGVRFADIFNQELVRFSGQAQSTMASSDAALTEIELLRLDEAIEQARFKESRDTLVMLDDKMFLVNVDSKTIVNMFDKNNKEVITGIDSFVMA
jgi:hypothetical protein